MKNSRPEWVFCFAVLFCQGSQARAVEPPADQAAQAKTAAVTARGDAMIGSFLARDAKALDQQFLGGITSITAWNEARPRLEQELYSMLGLWPVPERTPLHALVTGLIEREGNVVIERLHFQSRPGLYVTANLYRPKTAGGKLPAVLYVCGHASKGRDGCKTEFQDHGMWYALRVFPEDRDLPPGAQNGTIDETFVALPHFVAPEKAGFEDWKRTRQEAVRATSFGSFPQTIPAARPKPPNPAERALRWLATEPGIDAAVLDSRAPGAKAGWCTLIVLNEDEPLTGVPGWAQTLVAGGSTVGLAPRGVGPTRFSRASPPNYVDRAHAIVGRSVDQGRVWDVMAAAVWIATESPPAARLRLAGKGPAAIVAAYAAILGGAADEIVAVEPTFSHRQGPVFLDILRVLDVPEALGLLAPTPLRIVRPRNESFATTRAIYDRAGASESFYLE